MAGLLIVVSRTKPGTYAFMKLVSESEYDVILSPLPSSMEIFCSSVQPGSFSAVSQVRRERSCRRDIQRAALAAGFRHRRYWHSHGATG